MKKVKKNSRVGVQKYSLSELKTLGEQLLTSRAHVNNLTVLLSFISETSPPQHALESLLSLQAFFTPLLVELPSSASSAKKKNSMNNEDGGNNAEIVYKAWLRSKFDDFLQSLINVSVSSVVDEALREVVLDTLMEFVKVANGGKFHSAIYHKLLHDIVHSTLAADDIIFDLLPSKYFKYVDVCYFTYTSLEKLSQTLDEKSGNQTMAPNANGEKQSRESINQSIQKLHHLLSRIQALQVGDVKADYEMWNGLGIFVKDSTGSSKEKNKAYKTGETTEKVLSAADISKRMKRKFTKAWISFLGMSLPVDVYKEVLVSLHQDVIPHLSNPVMLCDFLTRSYDIGGVISVMALSSLYILMTQHGLEYPNFYEKLYALLEPSIFMAKHRAKFFQLLDSCLKSPLLPAYLAAAFTKKLSRLALCVPPSGELIIIALIHNLLRRHPSINSLVHQEQVETAEDDLESENDFHTVTTSANVSNTLGIDNFDNEQSDPKKTKAMSSSLWEIDTLRHHYCPPVSRFVSSLENDLTVRHKTTEVAVKDFSSGSYATIFNDEMKRRVRQVPLAIYKAIPTTLFAEADFPGWTFNYNEGDTRASDENLSAKRQRVEA